MAQTLVNGTAKELYSSEAGACEAAREPASKGSDTTLSKGSTFTAAPQLTDKYDDWVRITQEYWGATG